MFKIFKRNSKREKLEKKIQKLIREWHELYHINRIASNKKYAEAKQIVSYLKRKTHEIS